MIWLKNGTIIDGTNQTSYAGSVCVENGHIKKIYTDQETLPDSPAGDVIDCSGKIIAPGFIDAHSHHDFFAARDDNLPFFLPFIEQGVTTMIAGNCGFSAAGYDKNTPHQDQIGGGLFSNRGNNYGSFREWMKEADQSLPVNMASLVGHGTLRIGAAGKNPDALTEETLQKTLDVLERSLSEGAAGISYGLMYEPGQFAPYEELKRFAEIVKKHGKTATFHARACSKVSTSYQPPVGGRAHNLRAMDEVLRLVRETDVKTVYSHLIFVGRKSWDTVDESLRLLEKINGEGHDVRFDMYAMEFGASVITVVLPPWYLKLSPKKRNRWFNRLRLRLEIWVSKKALGFGFDDILVTNTHGNKPKIEGKTIAEIAKEKRKSTFSTYLDVVGNIDENASVLMYKYQNPAIIEKLRTHPLVHYMSDAWVEEGANVQNYAVYGNFIKFLELARDRGDSMEAAIHRMSGKPAAFYGLKKRGTVKPGNHADLVVFDKENLTYDDEQQQRPEGIDHVFVNGVHVVDRSQTKINEINQKPGRFIPVD